MQIEYWLLPAAASPMHAPLSRAPPLYFASLHQPDLLPSIQSHRLSSPLADAVHPQPHDLAPIDMPTNCDGLQTRRTHDGTYEHASAHVNNVLKHAFPLAETIQHAADAFLLDRRRYFDPERMRAIIEAREMAPTPLMQQVRIALTHTARDARALDPRAGLAHSRPHPMHVHAGGDPSRADLSLQIGRVQECDRTEDGLVLLRPALPLQPWAARYAPRSPDA